MCIGGKGGRKRKNSEAEEMKDGATRNAAADDESGGGATGRKRQAPLVTKMPILVARGGFSIIFKNNNLHEYLKRRRHLYNNASKVTKLIEDVKERYEFYERKDGNKKTMPSDVSLSSLLQQGFVCIILGQTKRINKYLRGIMRRIDSEQNLSVSAAERRVNRNPRQGQGHEARSNGARGVTSGIVSETVEDESGGEVSVSDCPPLPQGVKLVRECGTHCVLSSATVRGWPGIHIGRFSDQAISHLQKVKQGGHPTCVRGTPGLLYDNCDNAPGLHKIFPRPLSRQAMTAGEALEIELLLQVKNFGYDSKGRRLYGNRLASTDNCEIQEAHVDWKGADSFLLIPPKKRPIACLFPVSSKGCWIQLWPTGSGYGTVVHLEFGEALFFEPFVVHAGGLGVDCPRVQAYIVDEHTMTGDIQVTQYIQDQRSGQRYSSFCKSCVEKELV
jgi:hypothetical protein